jgi:hypothetical protein
MMKRVAFLLSVFFIACHHEVAKEPAAIKAVDPCTLMSADDVQRATGTAVRQGVTSGDENGVYRCTWQESGEGPGAIIVAIHVVNIDHLMGEFRNFPGSERLSELGDDAYWSAALSQLTMRTNGGAVTINFSSSGGGADHRAGAIEIAKKILPALS